MKIFLTFILSILLAGCSMFGKSGVETAPYTVVKADIENNIEIRTYDSLVLASTNMEDGGRNSGFRQLFRYITGENEGAADIAMTTPVLMDENKDTKEGTEIPMTAPVFMNENAEASVMSFVLPKDYTLDTAPKPTNPDVRLSELKNYTVAAIRFSGTLGEKNITKHREILQNWMTEQGYKATAAPVTAGYNAPFTLPMLRRNEVLIAVEEP